jgi:hypothetical protein
LIQRVFCENRAWVSVRGLIRIIFLALLHGKVKSPHKASPALCSTPAAGVFGVDFSWDALRPDTFMQLRRRRGVSKAPRPSRGGTGRFFAIAKNTGATF